MIANRPVAVAAAFSSSCILMFGPVSGGHFNPVVSIADAALGGAPWRQALAYVRPRPGQHRDHPARDLRARRRRDRCHGRAAAADLLARADRPRRDGPRGGRRLHRRRVLLHQLHQQLVGGLVAVLLVQALYPRKAPSAAVPAVESEETLIAPGRRA
jgi:hypothetical protein